MSQDTHEEITRHDEDRFTADMEALIHNAEAIRLKHMKAMRSRSFVEMSIGLIAILIGASGFGWFLLVEADILKGVGSVILGVVIAAMLHLWSAGALAEYKRVYKREFLPELAKLLGGFQYHPSRGISRKIIAKTGVVPAHDSYDAEDCFMGRYKGIKVLFSEARLHRKNNAEALFNGLFVLLEMPEPTIGGHIILSADKQMVQRWANTRWKKLQHVEIAVSNPIWDRFDVFADKPDAAHALVTGKLLKELSEASDVFNAAPLTAVFFRKKYIFMMIPYDGDMFEASNIHMPLATKQHALRCKREIEQLLEVIDVFDLYRQDQKPPENPA